MPEKSKTTSLDSNSADILQLLNNIAQGYPVRESRKTVNPVGNMEIKIQV